MTPIEVDTILIKFRENTSRSKFLETHIEELKRTITKLKEHYIEDNIRVSPNYSSEPHGSGVSDPVGNLALRAIDVSTGEYVPPYIHGVELELEKCRNELDQRLTKNAYVNAWLIVLNQKERFIIEKKMLDGLVWRELLLAFEQEFGVKYSKSGLKKIRDNALGKIYEIAK